MQTAPSISGALPGAGITPEKALFNRGEMEKSLVVSIHDVSPSTRGVVMRMLNDLKAVGIPLTSLLVIPDHHHLGRIDLDPDFSSWLASLVATGHEAVLHGFHHLRRKHQGEGMVTRFVTRSYTAGEGEFYDLPFEEASELLKRGKATFEACGLNSPGFIAPAWLLGREAERAVKEMGFRYTTVINRVKDYGEGREFRSRSLVYSVRSPWRRSVSLLWNEMLLRVLKDTPLVRLGLHPPDWEHPSIRSHILGLIRRAITDRRVTTYRDWLDLWRSSVHERADLR